MQPIRIDADGTLILGFIAFVVGAVALLLVVSGQDSGLYFANASTIAFVLVVVGVALLLIGRYRRRPRAFECFFCGYRVP
jgi:hypothetical protein